MPSSYDVPELKCCPFCGSDCRSYLGSYAISYVVCLGCGMQGRTMNSREEAIAAWNTRADEALKQRVRELEKALEEVTEILDRVVIGGSKYGWYDAVKRARAALKEASSE